MNPLPARGSLRKAAGLLGALGLLAGLNACGVLKPSVTPHPAFYALDGARPGAVAAMTATPAQAPTLIVNPPRAAAGYDSQRIIYLREPHKLEYFANSEWVDPPARMLAPLLVTALQNSGAFRAVAASPSAASGELRLDTEVVRLQQDFLVRPSQVRFTLRAWLVEDKTRRVLAWREFDTSIGAASDDPHAGVVAANRAVSTVLENLALFCAEAARATRAAP
jgi:cholesterol transport system auxiliary component